MSQATTRNPESPRLGAPVRRRRLTPQGAKMKRARRGSRPYFAVYFPRETFLKRGSLISVWLTIVLKLDEVV